MFMTTEEARKARFFDLMDRYIRVGQLLPVDELEIDAAAIDELRLILKEMASIKNEMDRIMAEQAAANS
ncbi:hypothetical protein XH99_01065 [Bradyrhizobium nanningense]|uniref:Uncharacterized protein n=2 Tax=Bradyrhizobium nanningense TaxID=1325118 RepID=A0A4Q0SK15_9BRAD|nr:hypothetical protein XH84_07025 [Bradyrhizobium nanningense]RXH38381.1 hypothetical protein XH99_01065 [Bradyrhizobium nanningense]